MLQMSKPPAFDHTAKTTDRQPVYQQRHDRYKTGTAKFGKNTTTHNQSVLSNNSAMNFYPPFFQPTRMSDIVGAGSSNGSSNRALSTRTSVKYSSSHSTAKTVNFYRSGDAYMQVSESAIVEAAFWE